MQPGMQCTTHPLAQHLLHPALLSSIWWQQITDASRDCQPGQVRRMHAVPPGNITKATPVEVDFKFLTPCGKQNWALTHLDSLSLFPSISSGHLSQSWLFHLKHELTEKNVNGFIHSSTYPSPSACPLAKMPFTLWQKQLLFSAFFLDTYHAPDTVQALGSGVYWEQGRQKSCSKA